MFPWRFEVIKITIGILVNLQQDQILLSGVTFGVPALPDLLEQLDSIRPSPSLLRVPKDHPLRFDVFLDQPGNGRAEGFLLIRTDPNKEPAKAVSGQRSAVMCLEQNMNRPVWTLNAGGQGRSNARTSADSNAATIHGRSMSYRSCANKGKVLFRFGLRRTYQTSARVSRGSSAGSARGLS